MRFDISPTDPRLDTELHIRVTYAPPAEPVTVRAAQLDLRGGRWESTATFTADAAGTVDLRRDAPVAGSYTGVDPMGPVWSMRPLDAPSFDRPVDVRKPTLLELTTVVAGTQTATATVVRRRVPDGLVRTELGPDGPVGVLYHPAGATRAGAVIVLAGAEAGLHEDDAALLAGHGYAALALALAGVPGRPPTLANIALEYAEGPSSTFVGCRSSTPRGSPWSAGRRVGKPRC
jgi:acyl-CoA thioester hydrolase/bile acid acetyltransferase-like protein